MLIYLSVVYRALPLSMIFVFLSSYNVVLANDRARFYLANQQIFRAENYIINGTPSGVIVTHTFGRHNNGSTFHVDDVITSVAGTAIKGLSDLSMVVHNMIRESRHMQQLSHSDFMANQNPSAGSCSVRSIRDGRGDVIAVIPITLFQTIQQDELERLLLAITSNPSEGPYHTLFRRDYCPANVQEIAIPVRLSFSDRWRDAFDSLSPYRGSSSIANGNVIVIYNNSASADEKPKVYIAASKAGDDNWAKPFDLVSHNTPRAPRLPYSERQKLGILVAPYVRFGEELGAYVVSTKSGTHAHSILQPGDVIVAIEGAKTSDLEVDGINIRTRLTIADPISIKTSKTLVDQLSEIPFWQDNVRLAILRQDGSATVDVKLTDIPQTSPSKSENTFLHCYLEIYPDKQGNAIATFPINVLKAHQPDEIVDLITAAVLDFQKTGTYHTFDAPTPCVGPASYIAIPAKYVTTFLDKDISELLSQYQRMYQGSDTEALVDNVHFFQNDTTGGASTIPLPPFAQIRPGETVADFVRSESANMNIVEPKSPIVMPVNDLPVGLESIPAFAVTDYQSKLLQFQQFYGFKPFEVGSTSEALKNPLFLNAYETAMAGANERITKEKARLAALPLTDPETAEIKRWSNITIEDLRTAIARLGTADVKPDDISKAAMLITAAYSFKKLDAKKVEDAILINHGLAVIHFVQSAPAVQMGITAALQARKAGPETAIVPSRPVIEPIPPVVQREPEFVTPAVYSDPAPSSPFKAFVTFFANSLAMDWGDELVCRIRHGSDSADRLKCYSDLNNELVRLAEGAPWPATIGAAIGWFFAPIGFFLRIFNLWKVNSSGEYVKRSVAIESFEGAVSAAAGYYQPVATLMSVVLPIAVGFAIGLIKGVGEVAASEIKSAWPKIVQTFWNIVCFGALLGGLLLIGANSG